MTTDDHAVFVRNMDTDAGQATDGDITIDSNHETTEQIQASFEEEPTQDLEQSASPVQDDSSDASVPVRPEKAPGKKRNRSDSASEAVSSAVGKQRAAERRAEEAEARIEEMSRPLDPEPGGKDRDWERFKGIPGMPTVDQFDAYEDYSMAMASFVSDVRDGERQEVRQNNDKQYRIQQYQKGIDDTWSDRLTSARKNNPNFDNELNQDTPMSMPMQNLVKDSPVGVEMMQWLSSNFEESQRLSTLHPSDAYREMGKLEGRLEAASQSRGPARVVSSARPPIKPLGTSPNVANPLEISDDLSMDEHFRRMNAIDRQSFYQ